MMLADGFSEVGNALFSDKSCVVVSHYLDKSIIHCV